MIRRRFSAVLAFLAIFLCGFPATAAEVAGVRFDESVHADGTELVLNGAGVRTRLVFKVYAAALYAPKKTNSAAALIESREPRRIVMHMLRDVDADSLIGALQDGLRNNLAESELALLKTEMESFERLMRGIGNARSGDVIRIDFGPNGLAVVFNGQAKGRIESEPFARALLKVWLGERPVDAGLKKAMLGNH